MRIIRLDGSPAAVGALTTALADALEGGPAVLPLAVGVPVPAVAADEAGVAAVGAQVTPARVTGAGVTDADADATGAEVTGAEVTGAGPADDVEARESREVDDARSGPRARPGTVLVATSGSTGGARLVVLPAAALRASATATAARLGGPARWLLALPADHVAGVQVIVRALLADPRVPDAHATARGLPGGLAVLDLRGGFRPDAFAAATAALGPGRRCTSLVPTQLLRVLDAGGAPLDALRSYAAVLVGGAALDPGLRARAEGAGARIVTTYGMTETAGGCVYDGVPLDGVRVRLEDDGRIVLGGPTLAAGYLGRPAETAAAFAPGPDGHREFRTTDLGRWADGRLEVVGRADDVIVTGGEKVAPAAVERVLAAQPGVRAACVVGLPDAEWGAVVAAVVVVEPGWPDGATRADERADSREPGHREPRWPERATRGAERGDSREHGDRRPDRSTEPDRETLERWRAAVREALGRAAVPRVLRVVDALPLRGIGKPDRAAVARLLTHVLRSDAAAEHGVAPQVKC